VTTANDRHEPAESSTCGAIGLFAHDRHGIRWIACGMILPVSQLKNTRRYTDKV
jgi:hypothetical protein